MVALCRVLGRALGILGWGGMLMVGGRGGEGRGGEGRGRYGREGMEGKVWKGKGDLF